MTNHLDRRMFLAALAAVTLPARVSFAAMPTDKRFVFVILRGAMDGLTAVPPYADRSYKSARLTLAVAEADMTQLDGQFGLHKELGSLAKLYAKKELLVLHAVATSYRDRSHFDAQNLLEGGGSAAHEQKDGWLNRALSLLGGSRQPLGLAVGGTTPLVLTGTTPIASYAPTALPDADEGFLELAQRLMANDPALSQALVSGMGSADMADAAGGNMAMPGNPRRNSSGLAQVAGRMLSAADGPRLAVLDVGGWDTHVGQVNRLPQALRQLDATLAALQQSMSSVWNDTMVVVVSEFGRTVAMNGNNGTDHGTATAAFVMGGKVDGGRVLANWPGLASSQLYQGRDLAPTMDLRSLLKGALQAQYGLSAGEIDRLVFPGSGEAAALRDLVRA